MIFFFLSFQVGLEDEKMGFDRSSLQELDSDWLARTGVFPVNSGSR